ncbi:Regulator of nonsense transcripts 3B [Halocaridina rubra]|uniref:Regulator of nonsense transcripts 3B n=1 Tax=Halocaridina rubra TaxID=373956 RepID=A0AAN8XGZ6_HALRR
MAAYKSNTPNKGSNSKIKSKYGSDVSRNKGSEKSRREKVVTAPTKVIIRRLPPSMTEETFIESVSPLPEHDYFAYVNADSSLGSSAYCRAYINFKNTEDVFTFRDKFDGYVFVDQKGNEHPAMVEYAPFQKIPKRTGMKKKDPRCGSIDEDTDYLAFLESINSPVTITLPPLEAVLEEIQAQDRELRANNGLIKVKTPLLEYIEQRKAEKLRSKEEKKEERRRKELERKRAREEERKKKKEMREHNREMRREQQREGREDRQHHEVKKDKEQKDDNSVKQVLRPERGRDEYVPEGRMEKSKMDRDKERQRRDEERIKMRKEKEKQRREREKEERYRRHEEKPRGREEEKARIREDHGEERQEEKHYGNRPEVSRSKRYSEGRRKEREKEKVKEEKEKEKEAEETEEQEMEIQEEVVKHAEKTVEREERYEEKVSGRKRKDKDPRVDRRIRNKDRPAMALYRPGQSRLSSRMRQDREEGVETSSSSPSPVMPAGDPKKSSAHDIKESSTSSRSDSKEESARGKGDDEEMTDFKDSHLKDDSDVITNDEKLALPEGEQSECLEKETLPLGENDDVCEKPEVHDENDQEHSVEVSEQEKAEENGPDDVPKDVKKYPGVKSMTFRRSVSRE